MAWVRMAQASSETMGSTRATESHKAWVYRPKRHAVFTDRKAMLEDEKIRFPKVSSLWDSPSGGVIGKALGLVLAADACTTRLSGVGCWVR